MPDEVIVPAEQKTVDFYGDDLVAVRDQEGTVWVPIRRLCEAVGVAYPSQFRRIQRDPVMSEAVQSVSVTLIDGRTYDMACLPLKFVRGWLFSITAARVKEEIRDHLIRYQREVIEVIDRAFTHPAPTPDLNDGFMASMQENARQQMELWAALRAEQQRLRYAEELLQEHDDILLDQQRQLADQGQALGGAFQELAELREEQAHLLAQFHDVARVLPAPSDPINPQQKARLQELVKELVASAQDRGIRLGQGRNDYAVVWSTFNQRFRIAKYAELPAREFAEAERWLQAWVERVREQA